MVSLEITMLGRAAALLATTSTATSAEAAAPAQQPQPQDPQQAAALAAIDAGLSQLAATDAACAAKLRSILYCDTEDGVYGQDAFARAHGAGLYFTVASADGRPMPLVPNGAGVPVTFAQRQRYVELAVAHRADEFDRQVAAIRRGLHSVVPKRALSLFSGAELERLVCGSAAVDIDLLKRHTEYCGGYKGPSDPGVQRFWKAMEGFTDADRRKFIRFGWGRSRLPKAEEWQDGVDPFKLTKRPGGDTQLPVGHTCFFQVRPPRRPRRRRCRFRPSASLSLSLSVPSFSPSFLPSFLPSCLFLPPLLTSSAV